MNVFATNNCPVKSAEALCNRHVVKMCLETAQMMSTVVAVLDGDTAGLYKATHKHHPCTKWATETRGNFVWLYRHGMALDLEYYKRYGKVHKSRRIMDMAARKAGPVIGDNAKVTPFAMAMPDEFKSFDPCLAYRDYLNWKYRTLWPNEGKRPAAWAPPSVRPIWA